MEISKIKRLLKISQEIIELAEKNNWSNEELVEAINLLHSKTIDKKSLLDGLI